MRSRTSMRRHQATESSTGRQDARSLVAGAPRCRAAAAAARCCYCCCWACLLLLPIIVVLFLLLLYANVDTFVYFVCACSRTYGASSRELGERHASCHILLSAATGAAAARASTYHLCCTAHKKNVISPIFCTNLRLEAPLPVYFSCTTIHRSVTTLATLLIPKCTTRRWTLRCSNFSVAKRQQFSCALSTATLSLKFENVVPEGWI